MTEYRKACVFPSGCVLCPHLCWLNVLVSVCRFQTLTLLSSHRLNWDTWFLEVNLWTCCPHRCPKSLDAKRHTSIKATNDLSSYKTTRVCIFGTSGDWFVFIPFSQRGRCALWENKSIKCVQMEAHLLPVNINQLPFFHLIVCAERHGSLFTCIIIFLVLFCLPFQQHSEYFEDLGKRNYITQKTKSGNCFSSTVYGVHLHKVYSNPKK